jgi:probable selenium-dependent hydroxylase accessory protein YqeC
VLCALDALGKPLDDQTVHRLDEVLKLTGAQPGDTISPELLTLAIFRGYASRIPPSSRRTFFLNKADDGRLKLAERVGQLLVALGATEVVFGEARNPHACYYVMKARGKAVKA